MKTKLTKATIRQALRNMWLILALLTAASNSNSAPTAWSPGSPGNPVNFEIDGNFFPATSGTSQDWSGTGTRGVLLQSAGASVPGLNIIDDDQVSNWAVDQNWGCSGCVDLSQFDGTSNKNNDDIGPGTQNWTYSSNGQGPQKNDLTNVMMFLKRSGGETWLIGGAETRCTNGDSHIDFEYNQAGVVTTGTTNAGYIKGNGPLKGRTIGDFVVCIDYENGGSNPLFSFRVWNAPGQYDLVNLTAGVDYYFAVNTGNVPSIAPNRGVSTSGNPTSTTSSLQFVEFALKSSIINALFNSPNACNTNATLNFKTRSSQQFTAELKDFRIMPVVITLPPHVTCGPDQCTCQLPAGNTFNLSDATCHAGYTYSWTKVSSTGTLAVNIVSAAACSTVVNTTGYGTAVIKLKAIKGACADSCTTQIIVRQTPTCSITVPGGSVCPNTVTTHTAPSGYDKYNWTVTGNATIQGSATGSSVQVKAGAVCGNYTVNLEAGINGCSTGSFCQSTCSQNVLVQDNIQPTISTLTNKTISCGTSVVFDTPTASDNCDPNPVLTFSDQFIGTNPYCRTARRTWTATDACGNTSTRTQDIQIVDNIAPTISALTNQTISCPNTPQFTTPTASDNCDPNPALTFVDQTLSTNPICRTVRRTWTATDACGNTSTRAQEITVTDNINPVLTVGPNQTINCDQTPVWGTPTATDNCDPNVIITYNGETRTNGSCPNNYTLTRSWTATDICGNQDTRTKSITFVDNQAPSISTLTNRTISCPSVPQFDTPTATDNCDPNPALNYVDQTIVSNPICRTVRRTWTATDACGNTSTRSQDINVTDNVNPVLNVGANQTISCEATPVWGTPTATDNCDPSVSIAYNGETRTNGSCPQNYTLTRSWTATDACGNQDTKTKSITFVDSQAPTITCPADKSLACNSTPAFDPATASDNCSTYTINVLGTDTTYNANGTITYRRSYNAVDACGNTSTTCSQSITLAICSRFCTYTQGAYGNAGGTHCNGQTTPAFVTGLLATPLTVGAGSKTITFTGSDANCLISKLPAGGTAAVLGGSYTCATVQPINNGKIYNILLGQTITLGLNMRINSGVLSNLALTGRYIRTATGSGTGCSSNGSATGGGQTWALPQSVITYLGTNNRVSDLFALANRALGGTYVPSGSNPSLTDINNAVDIINNAFDGCKILVSITNTAPRLLGSNGAEEFFGVQPVSVFPNPFNERISIRVEFQQREQVTVELFGLDGRKVAEVYSGDSGEGTQRVFEANTSMLAPGTYLCKVVVGAEVFIERIVLMK